MLSILEKQDNYTKQEIVQALKTNNVDEVKALYRQADLVRKENVGDVVHLRGIIEFSNYCCRNCLYCGIRKSNSNLHRYRIPIEDILKLAIKAEKDGYKTVVLQSGEDFYYHDEKVAGLIKQIKSETDLTITLAIGERSEAEYRLMKEAGADKFLLKHETSDPMLYRQLHPDMKFSNRIKCLKTLKKLGYLTGSGIMVGLPGQTFESIANDILLFKELEMDMIGIGPYLPHPETPLAKKFNQAGGYFSPAAGFFDVEELTYRAVAITRILNPNAHMPATTALTTINPTKGRDLVLQKGANVVMLNVGEQEYKKYYEIYPEKACLSENAPLSKAALAEQLKKIGREVL